ncbi:GNAT family N-acetyltransferase [Thalassorhabdomicrobium marinisediminis]|uniref:GNAT family N-acetyltransferase n=1 Tax=Thalassorhabdomicrobium marinisediminis TaxID=2170577 RepID=A0A2T7FVX3_9RHOB|nr:GNAT family N-acetyltransferase [Thalassorhabdomicrobium marinisediminis]PVA06307.1 GNAT family N-acetyltransferase [Thalassorhabdomicrobium marinisediminis]
MTPAALSALIDATWPAATVQDAGGWRLRAAPGAGSRVNAATAGPGTDPATFPAAEQAMRDRGQRPLFMVRAGEHRLDQMLEQAGYAIKDPTALYAASTATLATERPPAVTCFEVWPPLACQAEIWDAGGIDDARLSVMGRATGPKTTVLGRVHDTPASTAFAALHEGTAMIHAMETAHAFRRQGLGRHMIRALAVWAQNRGAQQVTLLVTRSNLAATSLYSAMGFAPAGGYHYRTAPKDQA